MLNLNKNYVKKTERPHTISAGATGQGDPEGQASLAYGAERERERVKAVFLKF